jgi:glycosyltransferase involved in cell wall biosynthesis
VTRVLVVIKGLARGGAEQLLVSLAAHLDPRFECDVAYIIPDADALVPDLRAEGWTVHYIGPDRGVRWVGRLRRLVKSGGYDIVHVHSPFMAAFARVALPRAIPLLYTEHNSWSAYRRGTYWANLVTYALNDSVVTVSDAVAATLRYPRALRFLRMPPVRTLYQGIDLSTLDLGLAARREGRTLLGLGDDVPIVGTVANFRPEKGHRYLLEVAAAVRERVPGVRVILVGAGPLEAEITEEAARMGLTDTVVFAGYRPDAARMVAGFDVFLLTSLYEGLPIALLEALALGCPVVATRVGGIPEVVTEGREGFLAAARDTAALAAAVSKLLTDGEMRAGAAAAARRRAQDFDIRVTARELEAHYDALLAGKVSP